MVYKELLKILESLPKDLLEDDVTICFEDEFYKIHDFNFSDEKENDVLDKNHFYLEVNNDYTKN